jgi:hypothetical protein
MPVANQDTGIFYDTGYTINELERERHSKHHDLATQ